jgi:hypothetical protein
MYETNSRCCEKLQMLNLQMWMDNKEWSSNLGVGQKTNKLPRPQNEHVRNFTTGLGKLSSSCEHGHEFLVPGNGRKQNSPASARYQTLVIQAIAYHYTELSLLSQ